MVGVISATDHLSYSVNKSDAATAALRSAVDVESGARPNFGNTQQFWALNSIYSPQGTTVTASQSFGGRISTRYSLTLPYQPLHLFTKLQNE